MTICVGEQHLRVADEMCKDIAECAAEVKANPRMKLTGQASVYGAASAIPDELLDSVLRSYVDTRLTVKPKDAAPQA